MDDGYDEEMDDGDVIESKSENGSLDADEIEKAKEGQEKSDLDENNSENSKGFGDMEEEEEEDDEEEEEAEAAAQVEKERLLDIYVEELPDEIINSKMSEEQQ